MERAHLRHVVKDRAGNAIQNALVRVFKKGTATPVADMYAAASGGSTITTLASNAQGEIEAWLATAKAVDLTVTDNSDAAYYSGVPTVPLSWADFTERVEVPPPPESLASYELVESYATSGLGTVASPWTHTDGTGGLDAAMAASQVSGKPVYARAGYYAITTKSLSFFSGAIFKTDGHATVLVPSGLGTSYGVDDTALHIKGTSGSYLENLQVDGFHLKRSGSGGVKVEFVRESRFGLITGKGGNGSVLRVFDVDHCHFDGVRAWDIGSASGAMSCGRLNDSTIGAVYSDAGDEALDFADCHRNQIGMVHGQGTSQTLDLGSCSYNEVAMVIGIDNVGSVLSMGINSTTPTVGGIANKVHAVIALDQGNFGLTMQSTSTDADLRDNWVGRLFCRSSVAGAGAVFIQSASARRASRLRIDSIDAVVPATGIFARYVDDFEVGGGYTETTGNAIAYSLRDCARPKAKLTCRSGVTSTSSGAVNLERVTDWDLDVTVLSSSGSGVQIYQSKRGRTLVDIAECQGNGVNLVVKDEADWRGDLHIDIEGRVRNIGKAGSATDKWALRFAPETGTPARRHVRARLKIWDDQGTPTTNGVFATAGQDHFTMQCDFASEVVTNVDATKGANDFWFGNKGVDGEIVENIGIGIGTELLPGLAVVGDPDTGFWQPSLGRVALSTNGVERVRWGRAGELIEWDGPGKLTGDLEVTDEFTAKHLIGETGLPTLTTQAAAGTGATAALTGGSPGSSDMSGEITLTTGTSPASGYQLLLAFHTAYSSLPKVTLTPANAAAAALQAFVQEHTPAGDGFRLHLVGAPPASSALKWHYQVMQ